jgi:uncharacterized protein with ParB-like and HNH nuclease domain/predicted transport protein
MKAHDSYLTSLLKLSDAVFNIPVYQRNYDWNLENCQQLFLDLETIAVTQKEHFIGSIVYISIGTATEPYYNIIDGQQRITSVMLFLKALHDSSADPRFQKQVRHGFLINIGLDGDPKMKLKQIESDNTVYEKIIMQDGFAEEAFTEEEKCSNVYQNYLFYRKAISQSDVGLQELYNAVFKLEIIDVCLTYEDPQEVFESMNSTGKSLTNTDLLRNYLLMDLPHNKQELLYKKYWSKIEKNVGNNMMDTFMVHYLIMKRKSDSIAIRRRSSKINKNTLYDCYRIYFPQESKKDDGTEKLLADMFQYSVIFKTIFNNSDNTPLARAIHELIYDLTGEPVAIFLMYLFHIQKDSSISDEDMLKAVQACISYVFRVRLFKGSISNQFFALAIQTYEKADPSSPFINRIWDALVYGQGSYRFPKDREFRDALETKDIYLEFKPPMIRYILYKFERLRTKEIVEADNVTIEHILPQDTKEWVRHMIEIKDNEYSNCIHKLGNLTLTKYNAEASNAEFQKKKKLYTKSGYAITRELANYNDWSSHEIKLRSASMAQDALKLWPLPDQYNQEMQSNICQYDNMDDATEQLFYQLRSMIMEYYPSIYEEPKKYYANYLRENKTIISIVPCQSYILVTLNSKYGSLSPADILEDVSNKGHWGIGDCRMKVTDEDDAWQVLDYIGQIIK